MSASSRPRPSSWCRPPRRRSPPLSRALTTKPVVRSASPTSHDRANATPPKTAQGLAPAVTAGAVAGGGLLVLVLVIPLWRRRAYQRADAQGRVIIDSPPVPSGRARDPRLRPLVPAAAGPVRTVGHSVTVKLLGPLDIDGLVRSLTVSPEQGAPRLPGPAPRSATSPPPSCERHLGGGPRRAQRPAPCATTWWHSRALPPRDDGRRRPTTTR